MENTAKYIGFWSANNGSTYSGPITSNDKKSLKKRLIDMVDGNIHSNSEGTWSIYDAREREIYPECEPIEAGKLYSNGGKISYVRTFPR